MPSYLASRAKVILLSSMYGLDSRILVSSYALEGWKKQDWGVKEIELGGGRTCDRRVARMARAAWI